MTQEELRGKVREILCRNSCTRWYPEACTPESDLIDEGCLHKESIDQLLALMPQWVSVEDELPDSNCRVIILMLKDINDYCYPYTYNDACEMGFYEKGKWYSETRFDMLPTAEQSKEVQNIWKDLGGITHWMPLPEPPEVKP